MNNQLDAEIRAALDVALTDNEQFAASLLLAAQRRRARRLSVIGLAAAATATAIAIAGGALIAGLLPNATHAQAVCGVGLLLLLCVFSAVAESERLDDNKAASARV